MIAKLAKLKPAAEPPRKLGPHGTALWESINAHYDIQDAGGIELLLLACQALDRAEECSEAIAREGATIRLPNGVLKDHPLVKHELANRSFVARQLQRLGLDVEPLKPTGRPAGSYSFGRFEKE
jgi:hypothetical protein